MIQEREKQLKPCNILPLYFIFVFAHNQLDFNSLTLPGDGCDDMLCQENWQTIILFLDAVSLKKHYKSAEGKHKETELRKCSTKIQRMELITDHTKSSKGKKKKTESWAETWIGCWSQQQQNKTDSRPQTGKIIPYNRRNEGDESPLHPQNTHSSENRRLWGYDDQRSASVLQR